LGSGFSLTWTPALQGFWTMALGSSFSLAWSPSVGAVIPFWPINSEQFSLNWDVVNVQPNGWRMDLGADFSLLWVVDSGATGGGCLTPPPVTSGRLRNYVF